MRLNPLVEEFLQHVQFERNLSPNTVTAYARDLRRWVGYLKRQGVRLDTDAIGVNEVRGFIQHLSKAGLSPSTVSRALWAIKSFYAFVCRFKDEVRNPSVAVVPPTKAERLPQVPKRGDVMRLLRACDDNYYHLYRIRDRAVLATLAFLGVRRQELIDLRLDDWDADQRTLRVRCGKGRRERLLPAPDDLVALVEDWLGIRPKTSNPSLFVSRNGGSLRASALYRMLKRLTKKAGLETRIGLHALRHYAATSIAQSPNGGLAHAQRLLGHQSPQSTAIYVHLSVDDLRSGVSEALAVGGQRRSELVRAEPLMLDAATQQLARQIAARLSALPSGWQRIPAAVQTVLTEWARHAVPEQDVGFPAEAVEAILWSRVTVPNLSLDDHLLVSAFGRCAAGRMVGGVQERLRLSDVIGIGWELASGVSGYAPHGEPLNVEVLRAKDDVLRNLPAGDSLTALMHAVALRSSLQGYRVGTACGRTAIDLWAGLWLWEQGLAPIVVEAEERSLWHLLAERFGSGDVVPAVAHAATKVKRIIDEVGRRLSREMGASEQWGVPKHAP